MQLLLGTLLSFIFLIIQVNAAPYARASDDYLAAGASFCLSIFFFCCTAFKYIELTALDDIKSRMSEEQRRFYDVNTVVLTVIIVCSVIGTLAIARGLALNQRPLVLGMQAMCLFAITRPVCFHSSLLASIHPCLLPHIECIGLSLWPARVPSSSSFKRLQQ